MWQILLNSVFNGWLKLLIVILTRKWAVLLTNCKWVVVNSIRIKNGLYILTNRKWAICSLPHTCGPAKLTCPLKKVSWRVCKALSTYYSQHTVLAAVAVGCRASSSILDILSFGRPKNDSSPWHMERTVSEADLWAY